MRDVRPRRQAHRSKMPAAGSLKSPVRGLCLCGSRRRKHAEASEYSGARPWACNIRGRPEIRNCVTQLYSFRGSEDLMFSLRLALISATLIFAMACGDYSSSSPYPPPPTPSAPPPQIPPQGSSSVTIPVGAEFLGNRAYVPAELNIAAGTTVTWINADSTNHTPTSDTDGWHSGNIAPGGQFSFAFQTAGTFQSHCAIHPGMVVK